MQLGRVVGVVVPCVVTPGLEGIPMLLLQPLDRSCNPRGKTLVAADPTRMACPGELVYYEGGRESALLCDPSFVPVDHAVVGIVDAIHVAADAEVAP